MLVDKRVPHFLTRKDMSKHFFRDFEVDDSLHPAKIVFSSKSKNSMAQAESDAMFYKMQFAGVPHVNYVGYANDRGKIAISIVEKKSEKDGGNLFHAIYRTRDRDKNVTITKDWLMNEKGREKKRDRAIEKLFNKAEKKVFSVDEKALLTWIDPQLTSGGVVLFRAVPSIEKQLCLWDQSRVDVLGQESRKKLKIGVMYCTSGAQREKEVFSHPQGSKGFREFLKVLGEEVTLQGFKKFSGGLDTTSDMSGSKSVYTSFDGFEIMYHVSTMLPLSEDQQQVERKRHISNDSIVIVYMESDEVPFSPMMIRTHYTGVYIIVTKDRGFVKTSRRKEPRSGKRHKGPSPRKLSPLQEEVKGSSSASSSSSRKTPPTPNLLKDMSARSPPRLPLSPPLLPLSTPPHLSEKRHRRSSSENVRALTPPNVSKGGGDTEQPNNTGERLGRNNIPSPLDLRRATEFQQRRTLSSESPRITRGQTPPPLLGANVVPPPLFAASKLSLSNGSPEIRLKAADENPDEDKRDDREREESTKLPPVAKSNLKKKGSVDEELK